MSAFAIFEQVGFSVMRKMPYSPAIFIRGFICHLLFVRLACLVNALAAIVHLGGHLFHTFLPKG